MEFSKKQISLIKEMNVNEMSDAELKSKIEELGKLKIRARETGEALELYQIILAQRIQGKEDPDNCVIECGSVKFQIVHTYQLDLKDEYFRNTEMDAIRGTRSEFNKLESEIKTLNKDIQAHLKEDEEYCKMAAELDEKMALHKLKFKELTETTTRINAERDKKNSSEKRFAFKDAKSPSYKTTWNQ